MESDTSVKAEKYLSVFGEKVDFSFDFGQLECFNAVLFILFNIIRKELEHNALMHETENELWISQVLWSKAWSILGVFWVVENQLIFMFIDETNGRNIFFLSILYI